MSKADTDHKGDSDGLMVGLYIESGIPNNVPGSNGEDHIDVVGGGTLTGLAIHKDPKTNKTTPVLVTCQHVMAGLEPASIHPGSNIPHKEYRDAQGTERMYHPTRQVANQVTDTFTTVPLSEVEGVRNRVDIAACEIKSGVKVGYLMHDPNHTGTGGSHAVRKIVSGTVEPDAIMNAGEQVTLLGSKTGEATAYINNVNLGSTPPNEDFRVGLRRFTGVIEILTHVAPSSANRAVLERFDSGDSGAPVLYKVANGVYRMVGIVFTVIKDSNGKTTKIYAFPASAAEIAAGITFGEPLPAVPSLNEQDSFDEYKYKKWRALTDFDDEQHYIYNVDLYGTSVRWLGSSVPGAGTNYHWWNAIVPSGNANPTKVRFSVRGSPEIDEDFAQGRRWGFKVYMRHKGATAWTHAFSGEDVLSATGYTSGADKKPIVLASFEVPIKKSADAVREYFQAYRDGEFEVKIEGAPANRAPVVSAMAYPNPAPAGSAVTLDATASNDPDGDELTYKWVQRNPTGETLVSLTDADKAKAYFVAPTDAARTLSFKVTATDAQDSSEAQVDVVVLDPGLESFGTLSSDDDFPKKDGVWVSTVASENRPGRYAKYYVFRLARRGKVSVGAASAEATYIYLLSGAGKTGRVLAENAYASAHHSRIVRVLDAGEYTIEVTTALPGPRTGAFQVGAHLMSNDATLRNLSLGSVIPLTPEFSPSVTSYTSEVSNPIDVARVVATASNGRARVAVNGSSVDSGERSDAIALSVGANTIRVVVTAEDGTQKTYTAKVTRAAAAATDCDEASSWSEWTEYVETDELRGHGDDWEVKEVSSRTNSCTGKTETRDRWTETERPTSDTDTKKKRKCEDTIIVGPWVSVGERGSGKERELERRRTVTNACGDLVRVETAWVPSPVPVTSTPTTPEPETGDGCGEWSAWKEIGEVRGHGDDWEMKERRTRYNTCKKKQESQERWVETETPAEVWPKDWTDTGAHRGTGQEREKQQKKVSNLGNVRYQWVPDPDDEGTTPITPPVTPPKPVTPPVTPSPWGPWSGWSDTGDFRFGGRNRMKKQERTRSRRDNSETDRETRWVAAPVTPPPPTWGPWSGWTDTGNTRGSGDYSEKEQSRTRTRSDGRVENQKRWVSNE